MMGNMDNEVVFLTPGQLISSTKLVKNLSKCLDFIKIKPLFIQRQDVIEAVLLSIDDYRLLLRDVKKGD